MRNKSIRFVVTNEEYTKIKEQAFSQGYRSVAHYLRDLALNKDVFFRDKLKEIYTLIKKSDD